MAAFRNRHTGDEEGLVEEKQYEEGKQQRRRVRRWSPMSIVALLGISVLGVYSVTGIGHQSSHSTAETPGDQSGSINSSKELHQRDRVCHTVNDGYQCNPAISHQWGQYSPYFSVSDESGISDKVPRDCQITFAQVISRHGARFPTAKKSKAYTEMIQAVQANATAYNGKLAFLSSYKYELGSDILTSFGERQMVASGIKFYQRYEELTRKTLPFIRAADSDRVVESGHKFIKGFQQAKSYDKHANHRQPNPAISVIISEEPGANNSLNHNTCTNFESSGLEDEVEENYTAIFAPPIRARLEADLPGVQLEDGDVVRFMDLCPFETVAGNYNATKHSPFCDIFTEDEWTQYNYLQSLSKYYGFGAGNPLGPTQGVGFVNELIARLTRTPVHDNTSTNSTLDAPGAATFPLNYTMYADFTHDNGMIPIFFALGLYNGTKPLPLDHVQSPEKADGFSAAWTVPFGARTYIEMMQCRSDPNLEPLVRVLVNDRVVPLHGCKVDSLGRCRRRDFINGLSFSRSGGNWADCYE
ncbi:Histidine phosphatase superfamilyclade-2 [Penicillium sp. IBT 31633x]|nr:Histidine phosphatase superfamilyclade-2 [Penicillium sp. IBT 31633x]